MLDLDEPCSLSEAVTDGTVTVPDDDSIADLYLETIEVLDSYGYRQYEVSNFAQTGSSCIHNLKYWLRRPVIGFGLASHSFDGRSRYANFSEMKKYLKTVEQGCLPIQWRKELEGKRELEETLFLGLRLRRGIEWSSLVDRFGEEWLTEPQEYLQKLTTEGLVEWTGSNFRLTPSGMLLSNEIFQHFL
jgi:oxygen-independent coproporphyrinogen-3 oxidase